jgi:hypothetical protein
MHTCIMHLIRMSTPPEVKRCNGLLCQYPMLEIVGRVCNIMIMPTALSCKYLCCGSSNSHGNIIERPQLDPERGIHRPRRHVSMLACAKIGLS